MKQAPQLTQDREALAIQALTFIAGDAERLGAFLAVTGIGPAEFARPPASQGFSPACSNNAPTNSSSAPSRTKRPSIPPTSRKARAALGAAHLGTRALP